MGMTTKLLAAAFVAVALFASPAVAAQDPTTAPADGTVDPGVRALQEFYARNYGAAGNFETRLGGLVSVISLSRYAGDPLTERLLEVAERPDPIVAMAAWDALAARADSLSPEQARRWQDAGLALATGKGGGDVFLGPEMRPLLLALAARPVEKGEPRKLGRLIERAIAQNNAREEAGRATLEAAGQALHAWADVELARDLGKLLRRGNPLAERAYVVLSQLPAAPAPEADRDGWLTWANGLELSPTPRVFDGQSLWFDAPIVITDSSDERFRRELELGELDIRGVDVVLAIDATGSLSTSNAYIQRYLALTMRTLSVLSDRLRVGLVYYRHEMRPALQVECCRAAMADDDPNQFLVRPVPLTGNFDALLTAMNAMELPYRSGHDDGGGAPAAGLEGAFVMLQNMSPPGTSRVIVVQADAEPTRGSLPTLTEMGQAAREAGVVTALLVRDPADARKFEPVAEAASGGEPISYRDDLEASEEGGNPLDDFASKPFGQVAAQVITASLPEDYADRGPIVVRIVAEHMAAAAGVAANYVEVP